MIQLTTKYYWQYFTSLEGQATNGLSLIFKTGSKFVQLMAKRILRERWDVVFRKDLISDPNDLSNCLETTKANLFADDTSLSCEAPNSEELQWKFNKDLANVHNWLIANKLTLYDNWLKVSSE